MKAPECGLIIRPESGDTYALQSIPLAGVRIHAAVKGTGSRVTVTQSYENHEVTPLEAVYVFPLEEGSAVCGFNVTIGDRHIVGKVLPRDEAFDQYDDAMADGHGAFLLDQERPNIFTASVGNILPKQKVEVEISYVAELAREGDAVRLMIPTTVSPRYVPESRRNFEGMTDGERVNPPVSLDGVPYGFDLRVEADLLSPIRAIESPSHKIRTEINGNEAVITLSGDEGALDRDLVLLLQPAEPHTPTVYQARDAEGGRFVSVSFVPEIPAERKPVEVVFLVDCSGSMGISSMEEASRTLLLCLQSLNEGDRFNIVRFGSSHQRLFKKSVDYNDKNLERGKHYAKGMRANLGGTEIFAPLKEILEASNHKGLPRRVVLLTDGQVSNEDAVIALAREHQSTTRIFAFGIGPGSSEHLVRGVARASGGAAEFVFPGERIENKVLRHFDRITIGAAVDLTLSWEGLDVEQVTPIYPPTPAPGEAITYIGWIVSGTEGKAILTGKGVGQEFRLESTVEPLPAGEDSASMLPLLWAHRRIRELEDVGDGTDRGSQQIDRKHNALNRELVRLGTRFGLMSSATSYVAIEERSADEQTQERAELRQIPVALTHGWGGLERGNMLHYSRRPHLLKSGRSLKARLTGTQETGLPPEYMSAMKEHALHFEAPSVEDREVEPLAPLDALLFGQHADGSWPLTNELASLCGTTLKDLKKAAKALKRKDGEKLLATLLMLHLLDERGEQITFKALIQKARDWVDSAAAGSSPPEPHTDWWAWSQSFLNDKGATEAQA